MGEKPVKLFHQQHRKPRSSHYNGTILRKLVVFPRMVEPFTFPACSHWSGKSGFDLTTLFGSATPIILKYLFIANANSRLQTLAIVRKKMSKPLHYQKFTFRQRYTCPTCKYCYQWCVNYVFIAILTITTDRRN